MHIRMVLFDAYSTILVPRLPVYVQYSQTFEPYLGVLAPEKISSSFKIALKQLQTEKPAYQDGAGAWWGEVVRRTAIGAGANPSAVDSSLDKIVPKLLQRFGSKEGYRLFDDSLPCLQGLRALNIRTGLVSNTDSRMRSVLADLDASSYLDPIVLSEEEGVEKPSLQIFLRAFQRAGMERSEVLHVGDELEADYYGARACGLSSLLVRRPGPDGEAERKEDGEDLTNVEVVQNLQEVVEWVKARNAQ
ncbi:hypothetical protein PHLGIDRAFT_96511 [Phlebiopsis gigantea 11061_1 CR5-6]|uniref:HAD hydrolase subfamily IA REG-2-like protein n=1 Tax=Phlebiopsis gigantea (strain 11061_1 CR5-6) TaxID=745531 RepID=A0A0C3RZM8_PHLG1|nr:hypothetical protein PHLGIDRAFT_96511 [Phlebiopsis gigantea 11061_1 CR5-6]